MSNTLDEKINRTLISAGKYAWKHYKIVLDTTVDSLPILEEVIQKERINAEIKGTSSFDSDRSSRVWGVYLGEIIRITIGGIWYIEGNELTLKFFSETISPIEFVSKKMNSQSNITVSNYFQELYKSVSENASANENISHVVQDNKSAPLTDRLQKRSISQKTNIYEFEGDTYSTDIGQEQNFPGRILNNQTKRGKESKKDKSNIVEILAQIGKIGLALFVFILLIRSCTGDDDPSKFDGEPYIISQVFVERELKSPSSARFPLYAAYGTTSLGNGRFNVSSYVDAENSFGAEVRAGYTAVLKFKGGQWNDSSNWTLESLVFH
ncbi:MAG: hypothetical protein WBB69_12960 [Anaerolineales bacterium]